MSTPRSCASAPFALACACRPRAPPGSVSRYIWSKGFGLQAQAEASRPSPDSAPLPGSARASMPPNWHAAWAHRLPLGELRVAHGGQLGGLELLRLAHVNQLGGLEPRRLRQHAHD